MSQPFDPTRERLNQTPLNDPRLLSGPYWDELRTFLAVAKSKSFNRAATMLNTSQPSVSRSIHRLQSMVGSQLLVSSKKGIVLTDRGRELVEALIAFDERLSTLSRNLGAESKEDAGTVRFSSTEAIAGLFVVPMLQKFSQTHPRINLHIRNVTNIVGFRENQSDIVLGFAPATQPGAGSRAIGFMHLVPLLPNGISPARTAHAREPAGSPFPWMPNIIRPAPKPGIPGGGLLSRALLPMPATTHSPIV